MGGWDKVAKEGRGRCLGCDRNKSKVGNRERGETGQRKGYQSIKGEQNDGTRKDLEGTEKEVREGRK